MQGKAGLAISISEKKTDFEAKKALGKKNFYQIMFKMTMSL